MNEAPDHANVLVMPPVVYLLAVALGVVLHFAWRVPIHPALGTAWLGAPLVVLGVGLAVAGSRVLAGSDTPVRPNRPTTSIVRNGPYRFTRNPLYLAMTIVHLGIGIWMNSAWVVGTLLPTLAIISRGVIAREEAYLERKFGDEYRSYKAQVRRWL